MRKLFLSLLLLFSYSAHGELMNEAPDIEDLDATVIEAPLLADVIYEDPSFGDRKIERDIAQVVPEESSQEVEWQGQLMVLKEIPYSYPQISRRTLQLRTLIEIEEEERKKVEQNSISQ